MIIIFVILELLAYLRFQHGQGTPGELILHILLSIVLFGPAALVFTKKRGLAFAINTFLLIACLVAYYVSFQTEVALGVPLKFHEAIDNLMRDRLLLVYLGDFLNAEVKPLLVGLGEFFAVLAFIFYLLRKVPWNTQKTSAHLTLLSACLVLGVASFQPTFLRYDTRLKFYFSWPSSFAPRGMERHMAKIDARDEIIRAAYDAKPSSTPTIILIFADSLRADHFKEYGYDRETAPFLTSLYNAGKLNKVDWAFSSCSDSFCGIATTFTSRKRYDVSEHALKFNELLSKAGYENWALVAGDHKQFDDLGLFYGKTFDHFIDFETYPELNKNDDEIIRQGLKEIPESGENPRFFYFFLMSSHVLGSRPDEANAFKPADVRKFVTKWHTTDFESQLKDLKIDREAALENLRNNYDNGLRATDLQIQNIFNNLEQKGYLKDALVFILGDHGDSLGEHNHLGHTNFTFNEDIRIPFYIYDTATKPFKNLFFATQEDIAPTILDRIGLQIPEGYSGYTLNSKRKEFSFHQGENRRNPCIAGIRKVDQKLYKYINIKTEGRVTENLFELTSDPKELKDIMSEVPRDFSEKLRNDVFKFSELPK